MVLLFYFPMVVQCFSWCAYKIVAVAFYKWCTEIKVLGFIFFLLHSFICISFTLFVFSTLFFEIYAFLFVHNLSSVTLLHTGNVGLLVLIHLANIRQDLGAIFVHWSNKGFYLDTFGSAAWNLCCLRNKIPTLCLNLCSQAGPTEPKPKRSKGYKQQKDPNKPTRHPTISFLFMSIWRSLSLYHTHKHAHANSLSSQHDDA